jgi:NitT/TauT family transport system substrate-binding protein
MLNQLVMRTPFLLLVFFFFSSLSNAAPIQLALNWKPEPEFGGFYEALLNHEFEKEGLKGVEILPGGAGQPVSQMVAAKKVLFGISSADQVILARSQGAKIVALFAVYQNDPHGFMVHPDRKIKSLKELFQSEGTIALEKGYPYTQWIQKVYAPIQAKLVPYTGGVSSYLKDKKFAQQCFVFSEPVAARRAGAPSDLFLVSESGYNPYLTVVVAHEDTLKEQPRMVKAFLKATRQGWIGYLKNSKSTNNAMQKLNPSMDQEAFSEATKLQEKFIITSETRKNGLGTMSLARWSQLYSQLVELKMVKPGLDVTQMFKIIP